MKLSGRGGRPSEAGADGGMGRSTIAGAFAVTAARRGAGRPRGIPRGISREKKWVHD